MYEKCKNYDFYIFQGYAATHGVVRKLIGILLEIMVLYSSERIVQINQELTKL